MYYVYITWQNIPGHMNLTYYIKKKQVSNEDTLDE
jgi:hypothetical protein